MKIMNGLFALSLMVISSASIAQQAEICNAALSSGIRDNYYVLSEREQYEQYQKRLCDARFSSYQSFQQGASSLKLDIPLAEGLLGLSGSSENRTGKFSETYKNYCESNYFDSQFRQRFTSFSSRVSVALTDSWLESLLSG